MSIAEKKQKFQVQLKIIGYLDVEVAAETFEEAAKLGKEFQVENYIRLQNGASWCDYRYDVQSISKL